MRQLRAIKDLRNGSARLPPKFSQNEAGVAHQRRSDPLFRFDNDTRDLLLHIRRNRVRVLNRDGVNALERTVNEWRWVLYSRCPEDRIRRSLEQLKKLDKVLLALDTILKDRKTDYDVHRMVDAAWDDAWALFLSNPPERLQTSLARFGASAWQMRFVVSHQIEECKLLTRRGRPRLFWRIQFVSAIARTLKQLNVPFSKGPGSPFQKALIRILWNVTGSTPEDLRDLTIQLEEKWKRDAEIARWLEGDAPYPQARNKSTQKT